MRREPQIAPSSGTKSGGRESDRAISMPERRRRATGRPPRILIVEDEVVIAMDLAQWVHDMGAEVIGPFHEAEGALAAVRGGEVDFAVLDYRLGAELSTEIASLLTRSGTPCIFLTGCSGDEVAALFPDIPVVQKPMVMARLSRIYANMCPGAGNGGGGRPA